MGKSEGLNQSKFRKRRNKKSKTSASSIVFGICIFLFVMLYVYAFIRATGMKIPQIKNMRNDAEVENVKIEDIEKEDINKEEINREDIIIVDEPQERSVYTSNAIANQPSCIIRCETTSGIQEIPMEDFLVLALGASIDMEYELETLKAQVVLLRGNCVRVMEKQEYSSNENKKVVNHNGNKDVDENSNKNINENESEQISDIRNETVSDNRFIESQNEKMVDADQLDFNYYSLEELKIIWGNQYEVYYKKAKEAVIQTKGIYAMSGPNILNGNFHAMSGGKTRSGEEILGESYSYLQSVPCEKNLEAKNFIQTKFFEKSEGSNLQILEKDSAGYVTKVSWNDKIYSGEQIRQALGLASANFEIENGEHTCITTKGMGHGFGFDQYYANYMAREMQLDYMELIKYFYKDISFAVI